MTNQEDEHCANRASEFVQLKWALNVANYILLYSTDPARLSSYIPPKPESFLINNKAGGLTLPASSHSLTLEVIQKRIDRQEQWDKLICRSKIWHLWQRGDDHLVFTNPSQPVFRQIIVQKDFGGGQLLGDFEAEPESLLLSKELEIVFYVNWMGLYGDLLLHAAAIRIDDDGYAFVGLSGAGKSTLAQKLSGLETLKIIGEDQVVLRLIDGEFWIYGSPWHFYSSLFAPDGVRLKGIYFLDGKGKKPLRPLDPLSGVAQLLKTAFVPYYNQAAVGLIMNMLGQLSETIPFYSFGFDIEETPQNLIQRLVKSKRVDKITSSSYLLLESLVRLK